MNLRKNLLTALLISLIAVKAFSEEKTVQSRVEMATVFFQGAELTHKATASLQKGENEIIISGLSPNIDRNSLKINATGGAIITSFQFSVDYLNPRTKLPPEKKLQDSINIYRRQIRDTEVKRRINIDLLNLLDENKSIAGSRDGLNVDELVKMMSYYKSKSIELHNEVIVLEEAIAQFRTRIEILENQFDDSVENTKTSGILRLKLMAPVNVSSNFTISYFTSSSRWIPYYDINVAGIEKPIKIASRAKVVQTTGLDWNKVKLTLSTSVPGINKTAPLFKAWFLAFQNPTPILMSPRSTATTGLAQNSYSYGGDMLDGKLAEVEVLSASSSSDNIRVRGSSSLADNKPLYIVNGDIVAENYINGLDTNMIERIEIIKREDAMALYGDRASGGVIDITLKNSMDNFVSRDDTQLNASYTIDLPYTIEGTGKEQIIDLQNIEVSAEFTLYSVPKLAAETFILAEISDWEKLGLLTGKANVTYDGTYVGETIIDANSTLNKLALTLGTDKRVAVKREKLQDFSSGAKFLGNDIKQEFVYQTTVKNNQSQTVKMVLKDQYPLSTQKDIVVELSKETTAATQINEVVGVLIWEFELKPGETRTFKTAYSVKYPKGRILNL